MDDAFLGEEFDVLLNSMLLEIQKLFAGISIKILDMLSKFADMSLIVPFFVSEILKDDFHIKNR